jgi:hypothetical protein
VALAGVPLCGGCAGQSRLLGSRTTVGSLRTSVSHLQHENDQLRRQVADLKSETRTLEDQLVQEEARNGDLAARLDDARHALRGHAADGSSSSLDPEPDDPPQRTRPAGRTTRKPRKPPFARIPGPGPVEQPPPDDTPGAPVKDLRSDAGALRGTGGWLPIARGSTMPFSVVR